MASDERVKAIRAVAGKVVMKVAWNGGKGEDQVVASHLPAVLDLAVETGRRLSAILDLGYADLLPDQGPHGAIRWRADADKSGRESVVPIGPGARRALDRVLAEQPGIGTAPLFPSPEDAGKPTSRHLADKWLREAETLAGLEPQEGSLWHAYRRRWGHSPQTPAGTGRSSSRRLEVARGRAGHLHPGRRGDYVADRVGRRGSAGGGPVTDPKTNPTVAEVVGALSSAGRERLPYKRLG